MYNHPADIALQQVCPTTIVPKFGQFDCLAKNGHRFLAASDGLWVEIRRPWLHVVWPIAQQSDYPMPYGSVEQKIEFSFGRIERSLIDQFLKEARQHLPNEFGAWLVWDNRDKRLLYRNLEITSAGPMKLQVIHPKLDDHESLAVDLHSHGVLPAFFSVEDDRDDLMSVKISGVFGQVSHNVPSFKFRLCIGGKFINIKSGEFGCTY